jgi:hypothetical protein
MSDAVSIFTTGAAPALQRCSWTHLSPHPGPLPRGEGARSIGSDCRTCLVYASTGGWNKQKRGRRCALPPHSIELNGIVPEPMKILRHLGRRTLLRPGTGALPRILT